MLLPGTPSRGLQVDLPTPHTTLPRSSGGAPGPPTGSRLNPARHPNPLGRRHLSLPSTPVSGRKAHQVEVTRRAMSTEEAEVAGEGKPLQACTNMPQ